MKKNILAYIVVLIVLVGAGAFYGGMVYGKSQTSSSATTPSGFGSGRGGRGGGFGANGGGGIVVGQIISNDGQSITVQLRNASSSATGSTKIVFFSTSTPIMKSVSGSGSDLQAGANVLVMGTPNPDGSVTAQTIQLRSMANGQGGQ